MAADLPVVPICRNPTSLISTPNQKHITNYPASQRGGSRSSRTRGGMRWTRAALLTRALTLRTAKSCGPDAPTLASSWRRQLRWRRWQTSPVTGESTKETVKTIARGMPGVSGVTVVTNACAFYTTHAAAGASRARHSLRPLFSEGRITNQDSRGSCGEIEKLWLRTQCALSPLVGESWRGG
jgi:hypothetical protein